jgi:hypothetical protein
MYHSGIRRRIRQTQLSFRSQHHKSSPDTNALVENSAAKAEPIQMNPEQQLLKSIRIRLYRSSTKGSRIHEKNIEHD